MKNLDLVNMILNDYENHENKSLNNFLTPNDLSQELDLDFPFSQDISDEAERVSDHKITEFISKFLKYSVNTNHPFYTNQLWSKVEETSILGELLAAVKNTSMYTFEVAPVATLLEQRVIKHLSNLIWSNDADGIMTSGGTASNLQALLTARNIKFPEVKNKGIASLDKPIGILTAINAHYSIKRAANLLGIGHEHLIEVPVNKNGEMSLDAVKESYEKAKLDGIEIFCLVSTAGTTVEGSYDNLHDLGEFCRDSNLWFHVDGAYGASVLMSEEHKDLMKGVYLADSLSWDFHKMLGLNLPCAFLFIKEKGLLKKTLNSNNDDYLFHGDEEQRDLGPSSIQCGRRNDITKLWLTWIKHGNAGFEKRVNKLFHLSEKFSSFIENSKQLELIAEPKSINVCFRFKEDPERNLVKRVRESLLSQGRLMINYSKNDDGDFFRLAITNPRLMEEDLNCLLEEIIDCREKL